MPFSWKPKGCFLWRHHHYAHMLPTDKATPSRKCTTPWFSRPYRQISAPPDWGEELRCSPPIPHHSYVDKTVFLYPIFWWIRLPNPYTSTFRPSENLLGMIIFTELILHNSIGIFPSTWSVATGNDPSSTSPHLSRRKNVCQTPKP